MACSSLPRGLLYSTSRSTTSHEGWALRRGRSGRREAPRLVVKAVVTDQDCNEEDCAPEKEVGKVSMEWKAAETTKVMGTYPPITKKKWTGYVEKDTAGQTNIYAVEPTVYVSDNVISSNTAGDSSSGSAQTLIVAGGLALGLLLAAALVLQGVNTSSPGALLSSSELYTGPNLSYYIQKFSPAPTLVPEQPPPPVEAPSLAPYSPSLSSDYQIDWQQLLSE